MVHGQSITVGVDEPIFYLEFAMKGMKLFRMLAFLAAGGALLRPPVAIRQRWWRTWPASLFLSFCSFF